MSIDFDMDTQKFWLSCDKCSEQLDTECDNFSDAVECKKYSGWQSVESDGVWQDRCKSCVEEMRGKI